MAHPLEAIYWRLERAEEHLRALNDERERFLKRFDEEGRPVIGEFERDTNEYIFRLGCDPPEARIGLRVGEFAHHLRAALDNLAWQLVRLRGGSPTRVTEFPIYESRDRYRGRGRRSLRGVSADDRAFIESIQPFQHGESSPNAYLTLLAWLNNVDKHRFLHVGGAIPQTFPVNFVQIDAAGKKSNPPGEFPWFPIIVKDVAQVLDVHYVPTITSDDRTELIRVRIEPSGPDPEMKMQGDQPIEVSLSDPEHALMISNLANMGGYILWIINRLRPRFDFVAGLA